MLAVRLEKGSLLGEGCLDFLGDPCVAEMRSKPEAGEGGRDRCVAVG